MGYFIEQTWPWWLLAIALAVLITWVVFRDGKRGKRDKQVQQEQARNGERAARERHDVHVGGRDTSYDERAVGREETREENRASRGGGAVTRAEQAVTRAEQAIGQPERAAGRGAAGEPEAEIQRERVQADSRKVKVPGQASSLKERVDQFKEMAEGIRGGRRSR